MELPRGRGKRLLVYLDDQVYDKAVRRIKNLDERIEQFLREELEQMEAERIPDAPEPAAEQLPTNGFHDFNASSSDAFFELNPEAQQPRGQQSRDGKRERLPVFKRKRRGV